MPRRLRSPRLALAALLLAVALTPTLPAHADEARTVYLVTMYPGDALFTGFGHIAFRIRNTETGTDDVFDYGTYEADDPLLAWKFLVGSLPYYCQHTSFDDMVAWYSADFGGILTQKLNLTSAQIDALEKQVTFDCLPENAAYAYHHFHNNCSTKLRDLLDRLLDGALSNATKESLAGRSLRDLIDASMARWQFAITRWAVFGLLNWEIDAPASRWEQMFLPWYLSHELDQLTQPALPGNPPLVTERTLVLGQERPAPALPTPTFGILFLVALAVITALPRLLGPRTRRRLAGVLLVGAGTLGGFYGTVLVFSWAVSPYPETAATLTLLALHPLHWSLVLAGTGVWRRREGATRFAIRYLLVGVAVSALVALLSATGIIPQRIWHYGLATLVFSAGLVVSLWGRAGVRGEG